MAIVSVHEATIHSFNVRIGTMYVGKKQVTMGLVRQLPLRDLVNEDTAHLHGVPWGRVLYWWKDDGREDYVFDRKTTLHVVWDVDEELHRSIVPMTGPQHVRERYENAKHTLAINLFLLELSSTDVLGNPSLYNQTTQHHSVDFRVGNETRKLRFRDEEWKALVGYWLTHYNSQGTRLSTFQMQYFLGDLGERRPYYWDSNEVAALRTPALNRSRDLLRACGVLGVPMADAQKTYAHVQTRLDAYDATWLAQYQALKALPQLFIAV